MHIHRFFATKKFLIGLGITFIVVGITINIWVVSLGGVFPLILAYLEYKGK